MVHRGSWSGSPSPDTVGGPLGWLCSSLFWGCWLWLPGCWLHGAALGSDVTVKVVGKAGPSVDAGWLQESGLNLPRGGTHARQPHPAVRLQPGEGWRGDRASLLVPAGSGQETGSREASECPGSPTEQVEDGCQASSRARTPGLHA